MFRKLLGNNTTTTEQEAKGNGDAVQILDLKAAGIVDDDKFACVLPEICSEEECRQLIARSEQQGYEPALVNVGGNAQVKMTDIRNNDRSIIDDPVTAEEIWARIRRRMNDHPDLMTAAFVDGDLSGWMNGRKSVRAVGLNERLRFLRYDGGNYFAPHMDGSYLRRDEAGPARSGEISFVTMMLYLNEGFEGGSTRFVKMSDESVGLDVVPRTGMVLLFQHNIYHEGAALVSGRKYCIRSDVMYSTNGPAFDYSCRPFWDPTRFPDALQGSQTEKQLPSERLSLSELESQRKKLKPVAKTSNTSSQSEAKAAHLREEEKEAAKDEWGFNLVDDYEDDDEDDEGEDASPDEWMGQTAEGRQVRSTMNTSGAAEGGKAQEGTRDLWLVRHGERIDETDHARKWWSETPADRRFDPPLTKQGGQQAAMAGKTLARTMGKRGQSFRCVYSSPLSRTLSTSVEVARALGISEVRVVFGLGECAAALRDCAYSAGRKALFSGQAPEAGAYRNMLKFHSSEEMQELCPGMNIVVEEEAPPTFEAACEWVMQQCVVEEPALVVTHREGIRDLTGKHIRLPFCTIAHVRLVGLGRQQGHQAARGREWKEKALWKPDGRKVSVH